MYRVSAWTREAKNGEGADKAHGVIMYLLTTSKLCCTTVILYAVVRHLEIVSCFSDWTKLGSLTNRDPRRVKSAL